MNGKQRGWGFGYGVSVVLDPAAGKSGRGRGAFGWGGAFGTTTWTDPAQEITAVLMVQQGSGRVVHDFEHAILRRSSIGPRRRRARRRVRSP